MKISYCMNFPQVHHLDTYTIMYLDHIHLKPCNMIGRQQGSENS